jgi:hypothetical protein
VQIFQDKQHRLALRLLHDPGEQGCQHVLPLPLRGKGKGLIVCWERQREEGGKQRHYF